MGGFNNFNPVLSGITNAMSMANLMHRAQVEDQQLAMAKQRMLMEQERQARDAQTQDLGIRERMLAIGAKPIVNGTVEDTVSMPHPAAGLPGQEAPNQDVGILRKPDAARTAKGKYSTGDQFGWELPTNEQQQAAQMQAKVREASTMASAQVDIGQKVRQQLMAVPGNVTTLDDATYDALQYPHGTPVLRSEAPGLIEAAQKIRAGNRATLKPGETMLDMSGKSGAPNASGPLAGTPPVIASGGPPAPTSDFGNIFLPAYAAKLGKTVKDLTPQEKLAAFPEYTQSKADPEVRASLLASRNTAEAMKQLQVSQQPTKEQAADVAHDVVAHRIGPEQLSSMFGGFGTAGQSFKRMVYAESKKLDPEFNWEQASAEYTLAKSPAFQQTVRYMDYVGGSISNVIDAADKLSNGNIRSLNAVKNWTSNQLNGVDIARFSTARLEVSDAIAKILQGGGTGGATSDMKLKQAQELIRSSDSPQVVRTVAREIQNLIGKRRGALTKGTYLENAQPAAADPTATQAGKTYLHTATGGKGRKIGSDDGQTWYDMQTGAKI
jgi:hypothetical protein